MSKVKQKAPDSLQRSDASPGKKNNQPTEAEKILSRPPGQIKEEKKMTELRNYVDSIAADLRKLYEADLTEEERETAEENGEAYDLYSYFDDVLDIEYTISGNGDFLGCRLAVTLGGPNVYVDTRRGEVEGYWGTEHEAAWIPSEICDEINSIFEEYYDCLH